jgi:preprotein translocase subunit SecG
VIGHTGHTWFTLQYIMLTVDGIPAHPLVVHAVVVLPPLAAVGTLLVVARPVWRRQLGVWVLLLALAGTVAVPVAQTTGAQLAQSFGGGSPAVMEHAMRASTLLLPAVLFLALLAATVVVGRRADAQSGDAPGAAHAVATRTRTVPLQRVTLILGVLAALAGIVVTGLVVWIGHAGSVAVWGS